MTSKIILDDGVTELTGIKSVTYSETVNSGTDLRPGCVSSACISVDMFGTQANAIYAGSKLYYYQVNDGVSTLIGQFYAEPSITTKQTYRFVAYDVVSMLDVDFSTWLSSHQENFPMTIYSLVSAACSVAGVTLGSASWPLSTQSVNAFYADNLTCRNILEYAAEIACRFVRANTSNQIVFDWYTTNNSKSIRPGATQSSYIAYKQDGLNYENYTTETLDRVAIYPGGADGAAFIYPTGASTGNTLSINGNLLLTDALDTTYIAAAQNIYTTLSALGTYRPMSVNLFPGENPFRAGEKVTVVDSQNVSFTTLIMNMTVTPSDATLSSTGSETYTGYGDNTGRTIANLSNAGSSLGKYVGAHLSMTSDGLYIISDNTSWRVLVRNDCVQILDDSDNVVAEYGTTVQIGPTGQSNIKIDSRSFKLVDKDGHTFLEARDLRDTSGIAEVVDYFVGNGYSTIFYLSDTPIGNVSVTIDSVATSAYTITDDTVLRFNQAPRTGAEIRVAYNGDSMSLVEMTLGGRNSSYPVGATSFTVGSGNAATGPYTRAFGFDTKAHGYYSGAEGSNTVALGYASHAEGTETNASGDSSHAEGYGTDASGNASHAEGTWTNASGDSSHAEGYGTDASGFAQTALGKYNVSDPGGNYAVIIGNGSDSSNRSNAVTVDWQGNVTATNVYANVAANGIAMGDASSFSGNFLLIDLNGGPTSSVNRRASFGWTSANKSSYSNIPTELANEDTAVGVREVFWIGSSHVIVMVHEAYPQLGRTHYIFYNSGSWGAWYTVLPSNGTMATLSVASGWNATQSWCKKRAAVVEFYLEITGGTLSSGWNTVGTLPSGYRPGVAFDMLGVDNGASSPANGVQTKVTTAGLIQVYKLSATTNNLRLHGTFLT